MCEWRLSTLISWWLHYKYNRLSSCTGVHEIQSIDKSIEVLFSIKWKKVLWPKIAANNSMNSRGWSWVETTELLSTVRIAIYAMMVLHVELFDPCFANGCPRNATFLHKVRLTRTVTSFYCNSLFQLVAPLPFQVLSLCMAKALRRQPHSVDTVSSNHQYLSMRELTSRKLVIDSHTVTAKL